MLRVCARKALPSPRHRASQGWSKSIPPLDLTTRTIALLWFAGYAGKVPRYLGRLQTVRISVCDRRRQADMRDSHYPAHPFRLSIEIGVAEKATNERGHFILTNTRHHQAVASMPEVGHIEIRVAGEKVGLRCRRKRTMISSSFRPLLPMSTPICRAAIRE